MFVDEKKAGEIVTKELEPWQKILLGAADAIEERGLFKGYFCPTESLSTVGPFCANGAMRFAYMGDALGHPNELGHLRDAYEKLSAYLGVQSVAVWNDHPHRTKGEVVAAMRAAAFS
jgi:hypothetical protein